MEHGIKCSVLGTVWQSDLRPSLSVILGVALTCVQDLTLGFVEPQEISMGPPIAPVKVPVDGIPCLQWVHCVAHLVSCANLLRVMSLPLSVSLMKTLNSTGPRMHPWGILLVADFHLNIQALTGTLWMQPPSLSIYRASNPYLANLGVRMLGGTILKAVQVSR